MKRWQGLAAAWVGLLLLSANLAVAAEIKVISVGAFQIALPAIAAGYMKQTGDTVTFTFTNPANLKQTLTTGKWDVIIVAASSVDELNSAGALEAGTQIHLARTGIGVAIKDGAPKPDLSTPESFKRAVLAARTIAFTDPTTVNGSGIVTEHVLTAAGLLDAVRAKGKQLGLGAAKDGIAKGEIEMGFFNVSESTAPGVVLAGPVPAPYEQYTNYDAAVMKDTAVKDRAGAFLAFISAPRVAAQWSAAGLDLTAKR